MTLHAGVRPADLVSARPASLNCVLHVANG
jgi:hypothetical protein